MSTASGVSFAQLCRLHGIAAPVPEYRFSPPRKWRFDWAWPEALMAIEQQGGLFNGGRHVRGAALLKEYEKLNAASALGWRVLLFTPAQMVAPTTFVTVRAALLADGLRKPA